MIKIIVDSAADCAPDSGLYDICIPLTVRIDGREYLDGVDLTADGFYDLLTQAKEFPQTSQPSPELFARAFRQIRDAGDEALCFTLSSALSGTYQSALIAREMVDYDGIYIVDTLSVSHLIGMLAKYAQSLIREGLPARQIAEKCREFSSRLQVVAGLDTLEYLYKGGRLSRASAAVGQIAGIKPIVQLSPEGTVNAGSKAIGVARAMQTIIAKLKACPPDPRYPLYTLCSCGEENPAAFEKKLAEAGYQSSGRLQVGPTIGAHIGPDIYGVFYIKA